MPTITSLRNRLITIIMMTILIVFSALAQGEKLQVKHAAKGDKVTATNGALTITCIDKKQSFNSRAWKSPQKSTLLDV